MSEVEGSLKLGCDARNGRNEPRLRLVLHVNRENDSIFMFSKPSHIRFRRSGDRPVEYQIVSAIARESSTVEIDGPPSRTVVRRLRCASNSHFSPLLRRPRQLDRIRGHHLLVLRVPGRPRVRRLSLARVTAATNGGGVHFDSSRWARKASRSGQTAAKRSALSVPARRARRSSARSSGREPKRLSRTSRIHSAWLSPRSSQLLVDQFVKKGSSSIVSPPPRI